MEEIPRKSVLAVGPFHPLQEEMEFFQLTVDGETVTDIDVQISYNHRGIEKLSETLQFDQVPFLLGIGMVWTLSGTFVISGTLNMAYTAKAVQRTGVNAGLAFGLSLFIAGFGLKAALVPSLRVAVLQPAVGVLIEGVNHSIRVANL